MKPRHTDLPTDCRAVSDVLARVGDKWSVLVVTRLGNGPVRFNELRRTKRALRDWCEENSIEIIA